MHNAFANKYFMKSVWKYIIMKGTHIDCEIKCFIWTNSTVTYRKGQHLMLTHGGTLNKPHNFTVYFRIQMTGKIESRSIYESILKSYMQMETETLRQIPTDPHTQKKKNTHSIPVSSQGGKET